MATYFDRLKRTTPRRGVWGGRRADVPDAPIFDPYLTFKPQSDEKWTYDGGHVCLNDCDVNELINENKTDVRFLCGIVEGLYEYQQDIWKRGGKANADFNAHISSLQHKVTIQLDSIYDDITTGVHFESDGCNSWINGVNVELVLERFWRRPTEALRRYLSRLSEKLNLIISRTSSRPGYDGIQIQAKRLTREIATAVEHIPPDGVRRLGTGRRDS